MLAAAMSRAAKTKPSPPLGAHVSVAGGMPNAFPNGEALDCEAIQVFVKNANRWRGRALPDAEVDDFRSAREASPIGPVVAHAAYLINVAAGEEAVRERSAAGLADELERCARLGVDALVLHPGAHVGAGEEAGIERAVEVLDRVLSAAPPGPRLLLENTAGQGTVLGHRLEHLAALRGGLTHADRVGVCLDTCHAFAAGYALHEAAGYDEFWATVEELLGMDAVGCLHLNDSLRPFASRKDRHAHFGEGEMGVEPFARLLHDERLAAVPMIIETETGDDQEGHRRDLELLRSL
jgi:deoxyribonuclease-4